MIKSNLFTILKWGFLALYTYFAYHLLFIPLILEFSLVGALLAWGILLGIAFTIPKIVRKPVTIFIILTIFTSTALFHAGELISIKKFFQYFIILTVVYLTSRYYGKLSKLKTISLIAVVLIIHFTVPRDEIRLYNHFVKMWESPALYNEEMVDYFPLVVRDIDGDGQEEIITFGNVEEQWDLYLERKEKGLDPNRMPYDIDDERLFLYVYKWNGAEMERLDNETLDLQEISSHIPKDYIGFPYYYWDQDFTLKPQIQKQSLAEITGQFGMSPFLAFNLDLAAINQYLTDFDNVYSELEEFRFETDVEKLMIEDNNLIVTKAGQKYYQPTKATKIIDLIRTEEGLGVLLLSDKLELWTFNEKNELTLTHVLTDEQINDVMSSEYIVQDINFNGLDEILISSATSRIIQPKENGEWDVLFASKDTSLRFEDFASLGKEADPSIISLSKSKLSRDPLRYLTGFTYTEDGLTQDWKTFVSLVNVRSADITGDGKNELVATVYKSHKVFIFKKHGLPVISGMIAIFISLVAYSIYRRVRAHA